MSTMVNNSKIQDWRILEFSVPIVEQISEGNDFMIKGVAINETTTLNNVKYVAEELIKAAPTFRGVPILLDHRNEIKSIVGRTTENVNFNPNFKRIEFEGKIMDKDIIERIKDGRIGSVSIGAKVQDLVEEDDGSMKAVGIKGLELSLVAVPGDSHANLAHAMQHNLVLKEKAILQDKLNLEENEMSEEQEVKDTKLPAVENEPEKSPEPVVEDESEKTEPVELAEEKVQNINVTVDNSEVSEMKKQIDELKELLTVKKEIIKTETVDETKGLVSVKSQEKLDNINNLIVESMGKGNFSMYRDYSRESDETNLKRLIR